MSNIAQLQVEFNPVSPVWDMNINKDIQEWPSVLSVPLGPEEARGLQLLLAGQR